MPPRAAMTLASTAGRWQARAIKGGEGEPSLWFTGARMGGEPGSGLKLGQGVERKGKP